MTIHIEGMGITGSLLAMRLKQAHAAFTWSDTEAPRNAWQASTGCIYPSGNAHDMENYQRWADWASSSSIADLIEQADYWFLSKHPPHGGRYRIVEQMGLMSMGELPSLHINSQALVQKTRSSLSSKRRDAAGDGDTVVVAHGFPGNPRHRRVVWGWMVPVWLNLPPELVKQSGRRPSLYLRKGRFKFGYAYPAPNRDWWYAGSSLIPQREAHELDVASKFKTWEAHLQESTDGRVSVRSIGDPVQGWRPAGDDVADTEPVRWIEGKLCVRPLWNSGIRHAPLLTDAALCELGVM